MLAAVKVRSSPCSPCSGEDALRAAPRGSGSPLTSVALHGRPMGVGTKGVPPFRPFASGAGRTKGWVSADRVPFPDLLRLETGSSTG